MIKSKDILNEAMSDAEIKKMHKKYKETGELPPHLKKMLKGKKDFEKKFKVKNIVVPGLEWMSKIKETRTINVEPNWEGMWRFFKQMAKTNPKDWKRMERTLGSDWKKIDAMAKKNKWTESVNEGLNSKGFSIINQSIKTMAINFRDLQKLVKKQDDSRMWNEVDNIRYDLNRIEKVLKNKTYNESVNEAVNPKDVESFVKKKGLKGVDLPFWKVGIDYPFYPTKFHYVRGATAKEAEKKLSTLYHRESGGKIGKAKFDDDRFLKVHKNLKESVNEFMNKQMAGETLKQLGGRRFMAMTGAKPLVVGTDGMVMKIGRNSKGVNYLRIDLKGDLYTMEFIRMRAGKKTVLKKVKGVYADQLQKMFTKYTGMYTSL